MMPLACGGQYVKGHCQVPDCGIEETSDKEQCFQNKLKAKV